MRLSIVLKTIAALPFIFYMSVVHAENAVSSGFSSVYDSLTCSKPGDVGQGLNVQDQWKAAAQQYQTTYATCALDPSRAQAFKTASDKYFESQKLCVDRNQSAGKNCLEKCSPNIQKMVSASQLIMTGLSQSSVVDSCSKMGQLMNIAQEGMTAFSAICGAQKFLCDSSCGSSVSAMTTAKEFLEQAIPFQPDADPSCSSRISAAKDSLLKIAIQELGGENKLSIAGKKQECSGYLVNLSAAAAGIFSAIQQGKQANACEEAAKGDQVAATADKCTVATNKDLPECICKANPRSPGCSLAADLSQTQSGGFGQSPGGAATPIGGLSGVPSFGSSATAPKPSEGMSANGAPAPVGGGGGSAALGGGAAGSNDGRGQGGTDQKMNTGIYGGEGGGGGGSGSRGGSSSAGTQGLNSGLREKMAADREIASLRSQVSSQGGKTNWEKVKDRYTQEKTNLLGR